MRRALAGAEHRAKRHSGVSILTDQGNVDSHSQIELTTLQPQSLLWRHSLELLVNGPVTPQGDDQSTARAPTLAAANAD